MGSRIIDKHVDGLFEAMMCNNDVMFVNPSTNRKRKGKVCSVGLIRSHVLYNHGTKAIVHNSKIEV